MISVIIPVYNTENFLKRCLDSLLSQTYSDLEIILIDDGSSDNSGTICDDYMNRDARVRTFHQANAGVSVSRNRGISLARGEFIGFVDSDDFVEREMYERLINLLAKSEADIAVCNYYSFKPAGQRLLDHGFGDSVLEHPDIVSRYINNFYTGETMGFFTVCNKLFKSGRIHEYDLGFKDFRRKGDDGFFNLLAGYHARKIAFTPDALYYYTSNPTSVTHIFERGRLAASVYNIREALELNERYFHLRINPDAFYRNTIMYAVIVMSDAYILHRADRHEVFREFYESSFFRGIIKHDRQLSLLPRLLCRAIRTRRPALSAALVRVIAALRRFRRLARRTLDILRRGWGNSLRSGIA